MRKSLIGSLTVGLIMMFMCAEVFCKEDALKKKLSEIEREMITKGNYKEAANKMKIIVQTYPNNAAANMDLGLAYYGLMEYEKAYEYLKRADELEIASPDGELLSYAKTNIETNRELLKGIESDKDAPEKKENLAMEHLIMLRGVLKEKYFYPAVAVPHIVWLKENAPDSPGLYELSASVYYSAMHYKEAVRDYKKAIEESPESPELYKTLADTYVALGDFDSAREDYDKAIELYRKKGLKDNSPKIAEIENVIKVFPRRYKDIADLVSAGRYYEAEEICKKRISLNAGDIAAITQLGQVYWDQQKRALAVKMFRKVIKMAPDYPTAHFHLGRAYFFEKKIEKGNVEFDIFEEKMDLLPEKDKDTLDFYAAALQEMASFNTMFGDYKKAKEKLEKAIKIKPDDARAHYNLAVCWYQHYKNRVKAYNELQKVIELDPTGQMADRAKLFIDYMRRNPDPRITGDFSFINED